MGVEAADASAVVAGQRVSRLAGCTRSCRLRYSGCLWFGGRDESALLIDGVRCWLLYRPKTQAPDPADGFLKLPQRPTPPVSTPPRLAVPKDRPLPLGPLAGMVLGTNTDS